MISTKPDMSPRVGDDWQSFDFPAVSMPTKLLFVSNLYSYKNYAPRFTSKPLYF